MTEVITEETKFTEILVEYDNENLVVYISGLDHDDFWIELDTFEDIDNPESFAHGFCEALKSTGTFASIVPVDYDIDGGEDD